MNKSIGSTMFSIALTGLLFAFSCNPVQMDKPRLLVLTDIGGDPDDTQALRRLLVYSNEFRIEGFVATSDNIPRPGYKHQIRTDLILDAIEDYSKVRENLLLHATGYPTAESLRSIVHGGQVNRGAENLAVGMETPGSRHIIKTVDSSKETLYIGIWGGAHDLAQALLDMKSTRSPKEIEKFVKKLRVYAITDQDGLNKNLHPKGTGEWIRQNFPDIWYVEGGPLSFHAMSASFRGMYQNDSKGGDYPELPLVKPGLEKLNDQAWILENVSAWGPLGAGYPADVNQNPNSERNKKGVKEGDTPSWFFVFPHGLNDPEHPDWGGWGGRFVDQGGNYYIDAEDDHWSGTDDISVRRKWPIARWREAYQNDFAARMRWNLLPYEEANHNPVATIDNDASRRIIKRKVTPGKKIQIDASASKDPDGDNLSFNWWIYDEVTTSKAILGNATDPVVGIEIPESASKGDIHLILEVKDDGEPGLYAYRRVILQVE